MNRKSPKTLEAVERERERERENLFIQRGIRLLDYIVYCLLENKKEKLNSNKNKGRTMPNRKIGIGLSFCVFCEKNSHKHKRAGP